MKRLKISFLLIFLLLLTSNVYAIEFEYGCYFNDDIQDFDTPEERYWNPSNEAYMRSNGGLDGFCHWDADELGRLFSYDSINKSLVLQKDLGIELDYTGNGVYKYEGTKNQDLEESIVNAFQHTKYDSIQALSDPGRGSYKTSYYTHVIFDYSDLNDYYQLFNEMPDVIVECQYISRSNVGVSIADVDNIYKIEYVYYIDDLLSVLYEYGDAYRTSCRYFATDSEKSLNTCNSFNVYLRDLENYAATYSCGSAKFNERADEIRDICDAYTDLNGVAVEDENGMAIARACSERCSWIEDEINKICDTYNGTYRSGAIGVKLAAWLIKILKIIRYIIPVLVIILSVLDYIGAVASADDDAMKKATKKFTKRIIASIVIFLLPVILQFLFDMFKIAGLESGNPFCMK